MGLIRNLLTGLIDIIYPKICHVCKNKIPEAASAGGLICINCWSKIKKNNPPFCYICGRSLTGRKSLNNLCLNCLKTPFYFDRAYSPCLYDGVVKELLHAFKYEGKDYLGAVLAGLITEFIREFNFPMHSIDTVIPVPLHKTRLRERGFNQALILSEHIAKEFGKTVLKNRLMRRINTPTQTTLENTQRIKNMRGAFKVRHPEDIQGRGILLVDDVLSSAATSSEASRALKESGANSVYVITLAN